MRLLKCQRFFALFLLLGVCQAGLLHRRNAKENALKDQIPVTVVLESDLKPVQEQKLITEAPVALPSAELPKTELKTELVNEELLSPSLQSELPAEPQAVDLKKLPEKSGIAENLAQNLEAAPQLLPTEAPLAAESQAQDKEPTIIDEPIKEEQQLQQQATTQAESQDESQTTLAASAAASDIEASTPIKASLELQSPPKPAAADSDPSALLLESNSLKALPQVLADDVAAHDVAAVPQADDLERQATQATPTQTSTQQNFVQQLIQNSPIGQFLSQFTGSQQQQQQQLADQPATPQPTLPGFLNPAAAITSAQQAVQTAAQSVVNSTTQAFQGLQQFATNLGTQFQNTFSNLAGQQNQLTTADSTTTRPPGPIQQIVSNFIGGGQNATGQQPGPIQGLFQGLFQGGNRPQGTTAPPKEVEPAKPGVDDKIEMKPQADEMVVEQQEPDSVNEVRTSAEVNSGDSADSSLEDVPAEELIVVNDDAAVMPQQEQEEAVSV